MKQWIAHTINACMTTAFAGVVLVSCGMIDEDQSDCGVQADVNYELRLVTNITTELHTQLGLETNVLLSSELRNHLRNVFTDFAHDVDLSFYDTQGDSIRLQNDKHIMDANQASYTLNLPMRQYMHLASANIINNELVNLADDERCHHSKLHQVERDTIDSHDTGLFTARLPMNVLEGVNQSFNVRLYMANCAACLVIDPQGHDVSQVKVYSTGFATGFNICDSAFQYSSQPPIIRTAMLKPDDGEVGFCSVNFPSPEPSHTRMVIETEEPFIAQPGQESLWEFRVYVPLPGDDKTRASSITETILYVREPLRAGELKIIRCTMRDDGSVVTESPEIGVSVTLDWKPGTIFNPKI